MATTYTQIAKKVLDWANRESKVLTYSDVKDMINYGVDNAYRKLRVAPMENVRSYTSNESDENNYKLELPYDLIEIIQFRKKDKENDNPSKPALDVKVFEAKTDLISFYDEYQRQYDDHWYSRERNDLVFQPAMGKDSEVYEIYYYRRLPEIDARYVVDLDTEAETYQWVDASADTEAFMRYVEDNEGYDDLFTVDPELVNHISVDTDGVFRLGKLAPNWLRDDNEKVVLFGALMQAGMFLGDNELEQRFTERFLAEIETLNMEDKQRMAKGGHTQIRFSGNGLI